MFTLPRNRFQNVHSNRNPICCIFSLALFPAHISSSPKTTTVLSNPASPFDSSANLFWFLRNGQKDAVFYRHNRISFYSSTTDKVYKGRISRSLRKRINKRARLAAKPVLDEVLFQRAISQVGPRFTPEELHDVIVLQDDPLVCLELFNWASQQHRFRHNVLTYHITIKKLGAAKMYKEMDDVVNQVLALPWIGSEDLYNTMIYYFTEARKLIRAVNIYNCMRSSRKLDCRPSVKTYNILFSALLSRGKNSYINHVYMQTIRYLFRHMVDDGVEADLFSLNCMIKGYVLSLHVNDALRVFHQMDAVYNCKPNSYSYDYLIHGLCAQGRTRNARELCDTMKENGFVPSSKSYNSLVCSLALEGEVDEALKYLLEMAKSKRLGDFITYRTVLDEISRKKGIGDALRLLEKFREKNLVDGHMHRKLLDEVEDISHNPNSTNHSGNWGF